MSKRLLFLILFTLPVFHVGRAEVPTEPVEIGFETQYFVDDFIVDNRWSNKQKNEMILRQFHQPAKHGANPMISGEGVYVCVIRDPETGKFKLWYQK